MTQCNTNQLIDPNVLEYLNRRKGDLIQDRAQFEQELENREAVGQGTDYKEPVLPMYDAPTLKTIISEHTARLSELALMVTCLENKERNKRQAALDRFEAELNGIAPGRAAITEDYDVDDLGTIRSPGKFEGEPVYAPYFWEVLLNGDGTPTYDDSGNEWTLISVNDEERAEFPELRNAQNIALTVNNEGFIFTVEDTDPAFKHLNEDNAPADEDEHPAGLQHENGTL